ncbi:23S rRNA (adenine(2030)-N(6))-methyltransferase RlmJ [Entomomonas asaccharolytica]|uniref:Ribosomal RNA large subunit methyltransferase J n=1 Tax=Entomomonas asaccharolytica TaxID=2785331 RepID=A0A974RX49_9GAMM|nr:23S rRNA (adenine(2030)-N(6))-methyltransferase RlmJ [Entomomonas asaccharolytica]QQP85881.1 23S rRNA (adenine(2030)-N(6))-methyltransferase RlmJ [Entomomonas asaccharolytica]
MNYRHAFHAGNHADVFKHIVLSRLIALLCQKETPFAYLDSHAGLGIYDLYSSEAERTGEWLEGIKRLLEQENTPELLDDYLTVINQLNLDQSLRYYPGSPMLAQQLMRPQDRMIFNEKHPEDAQLLKQNFRKDPRITIHTQDGWLLPKALLPTAEKRLLLLIDPPFEQTNELDLCIKSLIEAITRMRQAIVAIWYPIKDQKNLNNFYNQLKKTNAPKLLKAEFMVKPADNNLGLNGSGMVIANPPWKLEHELTVLLPYLSNALTEDTGTWNIDWLIAESVK